MYLDSFPDEDVFGVQTTLDTLLVPESVRPQIEALTEVELKSFYIVGGASYDAARHAVEYIVAKKDNPFDTHVCSPESDAWTIQELDEIVLARARLAPQKRHLFVILQAERMTQHAFDHLLKTLEEPPSPATFFFVVSEPDLIPATIRSRAAGEIYVPLSSLPDRARRLERLGLSKSDAHFFADLLGPHITLSESSAASPDVAALTRKVFNASLFPEHPLAVSLALSQDLTTLSAATPNGLPTALPTSPAARAKTRRLCLYFLNHLEKSISPLILRATTPTDTERITHLLTAFDEARVALGVNSTPLSALSHVYGEVSRLRNARV